MLCLIYRGGERRERAEEGGGEREREREREIEREGGGINSHTLRVANLQV